MTDPTTDTRIAELQAELDKLRAESAEDQQRLMFLNSQHGLMYTLTRSTVYSSLDLWRHAIDRYQRTNVHAPKPETPDDSFEVNLLELNKCQRFIREVNRKPLDKIVWTYGDKVVQASEKDIDEWRFTGLSNVWFADQQGWLDV